MTDRSGRGPLAGPAQAVEARWAPLRFEAAGAPSSLRSPAAPALVTAAFALLVCAPFAVASAGVHWDDAYIFFRYAMNLAGGHGLAFNAGHPSAGVTSLLWTVLLAALAAVMDPAHLPMGSKICGVLFYAAACALTADAVRRWSGVRGTGLAAGLLFASNPLGVVLAVSGMDTALALFVTSLLLWHWSRRGAEAPFETGLLLGMLALARPDGLLLAVVAAGVVASARYLRSGGPRAGRLASAAGGLVLLAAGVAIPALPWLAFVHHLSGHWVPPTRIGKLIERLPWEHGVSYREFLSLSPFSRISLAVRNAAALFGPSRGGIALLPPAIALILGAPLAALAGRLRPGRGATEAIALTWACAAAVLTGFCFLFPLPIPRYIAALLPFTTAGACLLGGRLAGLRPDKRRPPVWDRKALQVLLAALFAAWALGPLGLTWKPFLRASADQQVRREVGEWLRTNTPESAIVALEPIGEIGFVCRRAIVDLGGLVDPSVWPFIERGADDGPAMLDLIDRTGAGWIVSRPQGVLGSIASAVRARPEGFVLRATLGPPENAHLVYEVVRSDGGAAVP